MKTWIQWLDKAPTKKAKLVNQLIPVSVCIIMFLLFMSISHFFIAQLINPKSVNPIRIELHIFDIAVGFFLYFVTAVDYALIVGRMLGANPGIKSRFVMNVFTCLGCFVGVTIVLFLWGYAKEVFWLILPILIFAGSVMIKLAYEGREYFINSTYINSSIRTFTDILLKALYYPTKVFTFWIPELGSPQVAQMSLKKLAQWSFLLPFIIGVDDLVGYMGAMTIYNVFSLLFGIYLADIVIDILLFISPEFTKKLVENSLLSFAAAYAFIYLAYKSYYETYHLMHQHFNIGVTQALEGTLVFVALVLLLDIIKNTNTSK